MKGEIHLSEGNIWEVLLRFSIPFLIANVIQALYGAVDLMIIGQYCDANHVAAVSTGTQVTQIITSMITGLTLGGTILVGRYVGKKQMEKVRNVIGTTLTAFLITAVILTIFMILLIDPILTVLHTPAASFVYARQYVMICFCGIVFICGYNAISAILRGYGDSRRPMLIIAFSCILNIVGDLVFVKFLHLGVCGVAIATILAQAISMFTAIWQLNRSGFIFRFTLSNLCLDKEILKELMHVGIPVSLQECMIRISFLYLTSVTNHLGVYAAAAVGIASRYDVFAMLPANSIASALAAITAQNDGAKRMERANLSLIAGTLFALICSFCFFLWAQISPETMMRIFTQDVNVIQAGVPFFHSCSFDYIAVTIVFCCNGYLNGRSKTIFTMLSSSLAALCLRIPLICITSTMWKGNLLAFGAVAPFVSMIMAIYTILYIGQLIRRDKKGGLL